MAPTKRKGEQPVREAEDETRRRTKRQGAPRPGPGAQDRREDEGWSQPESSAQKGQAPGHTEE
jgi:hypothetical protein